MNRKLIAALAGVGILGSALVTVNVITANLGLQDKVQSCFKRYTKGIEYKRYSIELLKSLSDGSREAITYQQIDCAISRLGFDNKTMGQISSRKEGRVDNQNFALLWKVVDLDVTLRYGHPVDDLFRTPCVNCKVSDTRLVLTVKDYR